MIEDKKEVSHILCTKRKKYYFSIQASALGNTIRNQRQVSEPRKDIRQREKDKFAEWMCSWSEKESLWSSDADRNSLLKYIGRVYKQVPHMYRVFGQLKNDMNKFDELDLLNEIIMKTKQRHGMY